MSHTDLQRALAGALEQQLLAFAEQERPRLASAMKEALAPAAE